MTTVTEEPSGRCPACGVETTSVEAQYYDGLCRVCFYKNRRSDEK